MAFQFKIQLQDITDPPVWRRITVPEQFSFLRMHKLIQTAFGWENCHLFHFSPKSHASELVISIPHPDFDYEVIDCKKVKLSDIFTAPKQNYLYIYDFGDDWKHELTLENITDEKIVRAVLMEGKGACPPEDCGGPYGYANLKEIMANPKHSEHKQMKEWLGMMGREKWDAAEFDLKETKKRVAKL